MANSSRPAAPRSAVAGSAASPTLSGHRAPMSLNDIKDAIGNVNNSLAALCALLRAANGATLNADHLLVLLSPLHKQLDRAIDNLNDMHLVEPSDPLPVLDHATPAPRSTHTLIVIEPDLDGVPGAVVTGYYFNRIGDGHMHAFGRYEDGYFLYDENGIDVWGTFEAMSSLLDKKMGGAA